MAKKTREQVEALKKSWLEDPCWDIEETAGFGDFKDELLQFRMMWETKWTLAQQEIEKARADVLQAEVGITLKGLHTFGEISGRLDNQACDFAEEQVRATLLLAAQVMRVAEALESLDAQGSLAESVAIWGAG